MRTKVTAILVAKHRGEMLDQTLAALGSQTRTPDEVVAVTTGGGDQLASELGAQGLTRVLAAGHRVSFGAALKIGVAAVPSVAAGHNEWLWFLTEDSAPDATALEQMLKAVQSAPSVALAGPKLVNWDNPEKIIELGEGLTWAGSRWRLDRQELDQQQYDHLQDILGVGPVGMLVRRDVWEQLGGFDPALPVMDDGLDFSVRARLAGYRVVVTPQARVRFGQGGIAGPRIDRKASVMRVAHRNGRTAQLHRRLAYAPAPLVPLYWIALPVIGVLGMLWALIRERPGTMLGELRAALTVFFRPGTIARSRKNIRANTTLGWGAVGPLRTDRKTVRTVRAVDREFILAAQGRQRRELHFISTGGLALVIVASVLSIALTWWLFNASFATGGGMAPLSDSLGDLWASTMSQAAVNLTSWLPFAESIPADPFTWVLAIFGSATFWNPSLAPVLLLIIAIPVATLGGWMWGANLTEQASGRVLAGIVWGIGPMLLSGIEAGRLGAVIVVMLLPWLFLAAAKAARSWSWTGTASLLAAIVLASAPVLLPAALVLLIVGVVTHPTRAARMLSIGIAPLALFLPKLLHSIAIGRPFDLLVDPGIVQNYEPGTLWHMMLGFPTFGLAGWGPILETLGFGGPPATLIVGFMLIPLVLLALLGLYTGRPWVTLFTALTGALGLITAVVSASLLLTPMGDHLVPVWAGSGLALYWMSIVTLAALGATVLRRAATSVAVVAIIGVLLVVTPSLINLSTAQVEVRPGQSQLPAVAEAAASTDPSSRTLVLEGLAENELRATLVQGTGTTLNLIRTAKHIDPVSELEDRTATMVAGLASTGGADLRADLAADDIAFVLLAAEVGSGQGGVQTQSQLQATLDQNPALTPVGLTNRGLLWRVNEPASSDEVPVVTDEDVQLTTSRTPISGGGIWAVQVILLGAMLLLALPTGEVRERPERRKRRRVRRAAPVPAEGPGSLADSDIAADDSDSTPPPPPPPPAATTPPPATTVPSKPAPDATDPTFFTGPPTGGTEIYEEPDDDTFIVRRENDSTNPDMKLRDDTSRGENSRDATNADEKGRDDE